MSRKGWNTLNGVATPTGAGQGGGYNSPGADFDGFDSAPASRGGYQEPRVNSNVSNGGGSSKNGGGGGGWADWDDESKNGDSATASS